MSPRALTSTFRRHVSSTLGSCTRSRAAGPHTRLASRLHSAGRVDGVSQNGFLFLHPTLPHFSPDVEVHAHADVPLGVMLLTDRLQLCDSALSIQSQLEEGVTVTVPEEGGHCWSRAVSVHSPQPPRAT